MVVAAAAATAVTDRAAVVGRLRKFAKAWEAAGADPLTLSWLKFGVPVLLTRLPPARRPRPNIIKDQAQLDFVRREVATMLELGAVSRSNTPPAAIWQLMTAPKAGPRKYRLVVNMKPLTPAVHSPAFKLERLEEFLLLLRPGDHIWTRDLRDGYFHLAMAPTSRPLLGFQLDGSWYVYNVLPFGLRSAPFIFTKLMRLPLRLLRAGGDMACLGYIDDIAGAAPPDKSAAQARKTDDTLASLGLVVAEDKKQEPATSAVVLGLRLDTVLNRITLPQDKLNKTLALARGVLTMAGRPSHKVDARLVASLLGKLQWFARAAPLARLYSRSLQFDLRRVVDWSQRVVVSHAARQDLAVILRSAEDWNRRGAPIWRDQPIAQVFSDASNTGWGAALYVHGRMAQTVAGTWDPLWRVQHINAKELQAVLLAVRAFLPRLTGAAVEFRIDNITAVSYLRHAGGYYPHLVAIAKTVLALLLRADCQPNFQHLRGVLNVVADSLSRGKFVTLLTRQSGQYDPDDICLRRDVFARLDATWGPHTVDRFARFSSRQCARFWSRSLDTGAEGVNCLTADWSGDNNWAFPPWHMLLLTLQHVARCRAVATLVVPKWPAQVWWPLLNKLATAWVPLPPLPDLFSLNGVPFQLRNAAWQVLAVRVDGSRLT